jgi:glutathione synthase/RimK-type ligase-like ATP-grasp enzyme
VSDGQLVELDSVHVVWYRRTPRPRLPDLFDPSDREFARAEWWHALDGLLRSLTAAFVNSLDAERAAVKPRQLELARAVGLRVPDTLVTNDPDEAMRFVRGHRGAVVHKALTAPRDRLLDTRLWSEADRAALAHLELAPCIFQERVEGPADIRATVIGGTVYAARIETSTGRAEIDSRLDTDAPCSACTLPPEIEARLLDLVHELGLMFATADFKVTEAGEHFFLELNPQGQFLYIEILTGLPLAREMGSLLAGIDKQMDRGTLMRHRVA